MTRAPGRPRRDAPDAAIGRFWGIADPAHAAAAMH
jgi:hypothetical protein